VAAGTCAVRSACARHASCPFTTPSGAVSGALSTRTSAPAARAASAAISDIWWFVPYVL
jgi:hypothetical protein